MTVDHEHADPDQSEAELDAMTADMDEMHHASLPALRDAVDEWKQLNNDLRRAPATS